MHIDILSLFPGYFKGPFDESMIKRAKEKGILDINLLNIRDFSLDKHKRVDDRPFGGGPGMVMTPKPLASAIDHVKGPKSKVIYLSPQGEPLSSKVAEKLAKEKHLVILCGHYEGIDQRIIDSKVDAEISIGDYVLTNGCLAACVLIDVLARFIPGFLSDESSYVQDSFYDKLLDCPHYTRPQAYEGKNVPEVLISGDHKKIAQWRERKALESTQKKRPDLMNKGIV